MPAALKHVLCIDDEESILEIIKLCFAELSDIKITCVSDIENTINRMTEINPDMILLDIMMPKISGIEAIGLIRQINGFEKTPIVIMTARIQANEIQEYFDHGANSVIAKPFDPMTLVDEVKKIWDESHANIRSIHR